jgi:adenylate cyclase
MAEDEAGTIRTLTAYRDQIATLVREHRGRIVDSPGDNLLAEFPTALDAVQGAVEIQRVIQARNADLPADRRMEFRIGVHMGDVSVEGDRLYGDGVNIAARLEGLARPGAVCISGTVYEQVEKKLNVDLEDLGEQTLKNIPRPVHVYGVKLVLPGTEREEPERALPGMDELTVPGFGARPAIAVLPFDNLSGDPEQEYFADGIAEDLITRLSALRFLPVIARNSSFAYRGKSVDVKQVSRDLGVRYLVEGSVRKVGDRVRVSAQLIDATTAAHLWAERYDRDLGDIFGLQDEITEALAGSIQPELFASEYARSAHREPRNFDAWDCANRAMWHLNKFTQDDNAQALELSQRAIELAPEFFRGFLGLAWTHMVNAVFQWTDAPARSLAEAKQAAERSVALEGQNPRTQWVLGEVRFYLGERAKAIAAYRRAIELDPSFANAHRSLGFALALGGEPQEGISHLEKAMRLSPRDPGSFVTFLFMGSAHFAAERYREAVDWYERAIGQRADLYPPHMGLAASYAHLGRLEEARVAFDSLLRLQPRISEPLVRIIHASAEEGYLERMIDGLRKAGLKE